MKSKALLAAIAATFAASAAFAGGKQHGSVEVHTPASVSESAPWLAGQPHLPAHMPARNHDRLSVTLESDATLAMGASPGRGAENMGAFDSRVDERSVNAGPLMPGHLMD